MIRECAVPEYDKASQPDYNFKKFSFNCMPLTGLTYKTYARKVNQLIHGFVRDETADTWIKPKARKQDDRLDYLSLLDHYGGEGNKAVRIK